MVEQADRLLRTGLPLTVARLQPLLPELDLGTTALEAVLNPGGQPRSVLLRALDAARTLGSLPLADLVPTLVLGAAGLMHRVHILPFAEVDPDAFAESRALSSDDDHASLARLLLAAAAESARARRVALKAGLRDAADDASRLAPLGRAAITARRALGRLRLDLAATMPRLSEALDCSRPAAADALERLVEVGLATEITGRGRDRVYVDALAWAVPPA
ncbi:MAG: hypothetical protein KF709_06225 [Gemmatimonadaceae bacterium]|nr:hypothetical protein [Gemmatimonadaceae bacterium]